ncbi:MAG: 3-hydroxyacyl-CoA dehydrogenase NAD-binding domain-containing protein [Oscillospiraceae bacterium]|nr:3-hydroxyacyl-CoA dehydrogenase NAD-binding domain-containing protein [Oscillospiraceae bacterium]
MDKNVGVIGAGTMGWGIAQVFAAAGYHVDLCDIELSFAEKGKEAMAVSLKKLVDRGKIASDVAEEILSNVTPCEIDSISPCGLIVEAVFEDITVKKALFQKLEQLLPSHTVFATNTSALSITELASCLHDPTRFVGMHFFNPAAIMKLVEVISGAQTRADVTDKVVAIAEDIGKVPVKVDEAAGFVVNRILVPMINEAAGVLADGVSTAEEIDLAMKLGANHPIGPLALGDLIGLDVCLAIMETLHSESGDDKYRSHPLLKKMVRAKTLGRKTKKGFFEY